MIIVRLVFHNQIISLYYLLEQIVDDIWYLFINNNQAVSFLLKNSFIIIINLNKRSKDISI